MKEIYAEYRWLRIQTVPFHRAAFIVWFRAWYFWRARRAAKRRASGRDPH